MGHASYLSFTHCCSTNSNGGFQVLRMAVKKRMRTTLLVIRGELKCRRHERIRVQGQCFNRVVSGCFSYPAVPGSLILTVFVRRGRGLKVSGARSLRNSERATGSR